MISYRTLNGITINQSINSESGGFVHDGSKVVMYFDPYLRVETCLTIFEGTKTEIKSEIDRLFLSEPMNDFYFL